MGGWGGQRDALSVETSFFHFLHGSFILAPGLRSGVFTDELTCLRGWRDERSTLSRLRPKKKPAPQERSEGRLWGFDLLRSSRPATVWKFRFRKGDATIPPRSLA